MTRKKYNIFSILLIVAVFEIFLRLVDISTVVIAAEGTPPATELKKVDAPEMPKLQPPILAPAPAEAPAPPPPPALEQTPEPAETSIPPPPAYGERAFNSTEIDVLQSLSKRRDDLDTRAHDIDRREALLKAAENEIDRKVAELDKIKKELETLLAKQQTAENKHVESLVKIYEGMKPKEAARIFDTLDMDVLMQVISRMSERKTSPILAQMSPEKARAVTVRLSEMQKLPTKQPPAAPAPAAAPTN